MVTAVLPAYLVLGLHLSMAQYGALDGLYTGATAFTRLLGGYLADRFRQRKLVAFIGYAMSAVAKVGLLFTGNAPGRRRRGDRRRPDGQGHPHRPPRRTDRPVGG